MFPSFEKAYRIHVYETNPNGKLSIQSLFNYMQDVASDHAEKLGYGYNDLKEHNSFWVLSRLYFEAEYWPGKDDEIFIRTWPNGTDNIFAFRNFVICFLNGHMLAQATSSWLILEKETKKIQRPAVFFEGRNIPEQKIFDIRNPVKLQHYVEQGETNHCLRIKTSDLDINLHTNNAVYLKWISDSYDPSFLLTHDPQSVEINYLAESKHNEEIMINKAAESEDCFNHSIKRKEDNKELCRARMVWKPIKKERFKTQLNDPAYN